jgi:hypothetical protein
MIARARNSLSVLVTGPGIVLAACGLEVILSARPGETDGNAIAHKLRGAAAAIKIDLFPLERPPRHDSFMRMLGRTGTASSLVATSGAGRPAPSPRVRRGPVDRG